MPTIFRPYRPSVDAPFVTELLTRTCPADDRHDNWTPALWQHVIHSGSDQPFYHSCGLVRLFRYYPGHKVR